MSQLEPLLSLKGVSLQFGGLRAVSDFDLELFPGEILSLIGPNGAGKTTVFNIVTGIYPPTSGRIEFRSHSLLRLRPNRIAALGVTRTFQNIRLFKDLTVLDNVKIAFHIHHKYGLMSGILRLRRYWREEADTTDRARKLLALFGLDGRASEMASSLPYGDQRRLEIVRALATEPAVLLLDEPAAGMNPSEKGSLMQMIRRIRTEFDLAILLIEHDMRVVMEISDRIIVLDHGATIARGVPSVIQRDPKVIEAYLGAED